MNSCCRKLWILILFNLTFSLNSCAQSENNTDRSPFLKSAVDQTIQGNFSTQTRSSFDSTQITLFLGEYPKLKRYESDLMNFYRKRNFSYAWFENGKLIEQAGNLINRVLNLEDDGVFKKLSYASTLDSLANGEGVLSNVPVPNIKLELLLTAEYFVFSNLVWEGMNPFVSKSNNWLLPRKKVAYDVYLDSLLKLPFEVPAKEPVYRQYELLKTYLRKYIQLDNQSNWLVINGLSKVIAANDTPLIVSKIKIRLVQLGDYRQKLIDTLFDMELGKALLRFQRRHGLATTGHINSETIHELNVPLKQRIKQILVNMERSRWLPVTSQGDYIAVNIPEFKMHVYHNDNLLWSCKAVVGQAIHRTTLFYGEIKTIVFSPYWNVPESIVSKEILPAMQRDKRYLIKHRMEIIGKRNGLPIIRQKPGLSNSLGLVKFLFPNSYNIYLHDTPIKSLFYETDRAFSHGCIRIAEPAKLASFLLKDDHKWNAEVINSAMNSLKEQYVPLTQKVPVFIAYFTAFIDRDKDLNFRKDIYGLDEQLSSMIILGEGKY